MTDSLRADLDAEKRRMREGTDDHFYGAWVGGGKGQGGRPVGGGGAPLYRSKDYSGAHAVDALDRVGPGSFVSVDAGATTYTGRLLTTKPAVRLRRKSGETHTIRRDSVTRARLLSASEYARAPVTGKANISTEVRRGSAGERVEGGRLRFYAEATPDPVARDVAGEMTRWREASEDDHFYGAWQGGSKGAGGRPGGWSSRRAAAQGGRTLSQGGTTAKAFGKGVPRVGFMVSPYPEYEHKLPVKGQTPSSLGKEFRSYIDRHGDVLNRPNHYLGAWVDGGTIYMDISIREATREGARALAEKHKQLAAYDLKTGDTVRFDEAAAVRRVVISADATDDELEQAAAYLLGDDEDK